MAVANPATVVFGTADIFQRIMSLVLLLLYFCAAVGLLVVVIILRILLRILLRSSSGWKSCLKTSQVT